MITPPPELHPRIIELIGALQASRNELHACLNAMSEQQRTAPPIGNVWSVEQNLEHLTLIEGGIGRLISSLMKQAAATGTQETETSTVLNCLATWNPARISQPLPAPDAMLPKEGITVEEALVRLGASRARLLSVLPSASGLPLATVTAPHPFLGDLNGYQWILLIAEHERRHTRQIEDVASRFVAPLH